jgi:hypothetical protein
MTDLEVYQAPAPVAVPEHDDIDSWISVAAQVIKLANEICNTPFVPDGLRGSAPATAAAILAGREMGLGPFTSLQHIHCIKGKIGQSAVLMRALIISRGHQWEDGEITDTRAVVRGRRKGEAEWTTASFTADQARKAGIQLGGYPQDKLYARATVRLARRKFADVIMGMPYSAEELEDGEVPGDVPAPAAVQNGNGQEPPKASPRTARRKTAAAGDDTRGQRPAGTQAPQPESAADSTAQDARPGAAGAAPSRGAQPLPPLPGEDEPDGTAGPEHAADLAPGEAAEFGTERHAKVVGIVWAHLRRLGYPDDKSETDEEKADRLADVAKLAGVAEIGSTSDLDLGELSLAADTLAKCKNRARLDAILGKAGDGDD